MTRQAACACGKLSLICEGEPVRISVCHCLECQRRTGSIFGAQAWFPRDRVTKSTEGAARFVRVADSGKNIVFHFCPDCGSTLFWEPQASPEVLAVAVGAFADPNFPPPNHSVWERRRHGWACVPEGVQHSD